MIMTSGAVTGDSGTWCVAGPVDRTLGQQNGREVTNGSVKCAGTVTGAERSLTPSYGTASSDSPLHAALGGVLSPLVQFAAPLG